MAALIAAEIPIGRAGTGEDVASWRYTGPIGLGLPDRPALWTAL
jgi:hypothetical protein